MITRMLRPCLLLLVLCAGMPAMAQNTDWAAPSDREAASGIEDVEAADPGLPTDPTPVPVDGGLTLLGAAGAAYAVKRLRQRRTQDAV